MLSAKFDRYRHNTKNKYSLCNVFTLLSSHLSDHSLHVQFSLDTIKS